MFYFVDVDELPDAITEINEAAKKIVDLIKQQYIDCSDEEDEMPADEQEQRQKDRMEAGGNFGRAQGAFAAAAQQELTWKQGLTPSQTSKYKDAIKAGFRRAKAERRKAKLHKVLNTVLWGSARTASTYHQPDDTG